MTDATDRHQALERYRQAYREFLTNDGVIDAEERSVLDQIAQSEGLSVDELNAVHERVGQDKDVRIRLAQLSDEDPAYQVYTLLDTSGPLTMARVIEQLGADDAPKWQAALEDLLFDYHVVPVGQGEERLFYVRDSVVAQVVDTLVSGREPLTAEDLLNRAGLPLQLWDVIVASLHAWGMVETIERESGLHYGLTSSYLAYEIVSLEAPLKEAEIIERLGDNGQALWEQALSDPYFHQELCNMGEAVGFALLEPLQRRVLRLLQEGPGLTKTQIIERLGWGEAAWAALKEYVLDTEWVDTDVGEEGTLYRAVSS